MGLSAEYIVVKTLDPMKHPDLKAFRNEVRLLKRYGIEARQRASRNNDPAHRHLTILLATYTTGGKNCLVFPAAECDLEDYFQVTKGLLESPENIDKDAVQWITAQILGITAVVDLMHGEHQQTLSEKKMYTRHGDLKLENILWFKSKTDPRGVFVIGDLGLADIHGEYSRSNVPADKIAVTMAYRAPECDIKNATINRQYDIWTLGCVFLEMISWLLGDGTRSNDFKLHMQGTRAKMYFDTVQLLSNGKFRFTVKKEVLEVRAWQSLR